MVPVKCPSITKLKKDQIYAIDDPIKIVSFPKLIIFSVSGVLP